MSVRFSPPAAPRFRRAVAINGGRGGRGGSCVAARALFGLLVGCAALASTAAPVAAQTAYPMVMSLHPVAAQVGSTSEHVVHTRYSTEESYRVLVTGEGVTGEVVAPAAAESGGGEDKKPAKSNPQELAVRFTVAPDAVPGVREFRVATPRGVSTVGQLVIARDGVVVEAAGNDTRETAQEVTLPATLCGTIEKAEDVDFYRFTADAGDPYTFHVRSMRLQDKIHDLQQHSDPILTLRNAAGQTLAASDNFFRGDPCIAYRFEQAGEYYLEIRDVRYQGNKYWEYSIEASRGPFVTNVYPLAVAPGQSPAVELVGFHLPDDSTGRVEVPETCQPGYRWEAVRAGEAVTNPAPLIVSDLPLVRETDAANDSPEQAQQVALPVGINGRLERPQDVDCFAFEARKGQRYAWEVVAARQQSSVDSYLRIVDQSGKTLAENDDLRAGKRGSSDSRIDNWSAPADGVYYLEIRDLHLRGGPGFVYLIRGTQSAPDFELYADTDKTLVTPGTAGVVFVRAERKNGFDGEIQLEIDGLPEGVTAACGKILAGKSQDGCIVLQAAPGTAPATSNVVIRGRAIVETGAAAGAEAGTEPEDAAAGAQPRTLVREATIYQETYQPGGGRGHWPVSTHAVSVGRPADLTAVELSTYELKLRPGQTQRVEVTITRAEGFDKNVILEVVYKHLNSVYGDSLPTGVTIDGPNSNTLLTSGAVRGHLTFKVADDAPPVQGQQVVVMANVSLNFVMKATYASAPLKISVAGGAGTGP